MHDAMSGMTAGLEGKQGEEFDKAFIDEMIVHHQGAIEMANMAKLKSQRVEIQQLAGDIITAQSSEINMMHGWYEQWFGTQHGH